MADFYRPLCPGRSESHYLAVSRGMTLAWGVARVAVALAALRWAGERSVIDQVLKVAGFTTGSILGLFLLGSRRGPVRSWAALAGLVAGFAAVFAVWLPSLGSGPALAWPWYAPIGTVTTVAVALLLNMVQCPMSNVGLEPATLDFGLRTLDLGLFEWTICKRRREIKPPQTWMSCRLWISRG
jgi:Na+/proline symporter